MSNDIRPADGSHMSEAAAPAPVWVFMTLGLLAAVAVWSPLMGSAVGMAFLAAICAVGILLVSKSTATVAASKGAVVPLALASLLLVALFATSIYGSAVGLNWLSWVAAVAAIPTVAFGLFVADRRSAAVTSSR